MTGDGQLLSWVMFDYGGVISAHQSADDVTALAELAGCSRVELQAAYWAHRLDYDRADLDGRTFWQKVGASLGCALGEAQIAGLIELDTRSWLHLQAETVALIEEAAAAGARLALLSNAPAEVAAAVSELPVARHFQHLAFSCELGAVKPDPACYRAVLTDLGAAPGEVMFIDDRPENVAGATAAGLRAVHFTGAEVIRVELARYGVIAG